MGNTAWVTVNQKIKLLKASLLKIKGRLLEIPTLQLIFRTIEGSGKHDATQRAAGVAYYTILSVFPLLLGLIALFGYFLPSANLQNQLLKIVGNYFPGATDILMQNIANVVELRGAVGITSIIVLFWGASAMFSSMSLAINRAWDISLHRPFFIRKANELGMALSMGILFLLSLGASAVISVLRGVLNLPAAKLIVVVIGSRLIAFLLILAVFLLLYKLIPNTKTFWRYVWPGALLTAIFFEFARTLFIFYLEHLANYQLIYGAITSIIILLIWIYYSALIIILGAEFTSQYSHMRYSVGAGNGAEK
jgi:membrane protein